MKGQAVHFWYKSHISKGKWPAGTYDAGKIRSRIWIGEKHGASGGYKDKDLILNLKLRRKDTKKGFFAPSQAVFPTDQTIVPHRKTVELEKIDGEFDDCETLEIIGENKILRTADNQIIVYKSHEQCKPA